jgi:hypothetical protein
LQYVGLASGQENDYLDNPAAPQKERFWKRQFSLTGTKAQRRFDVIVGAIIPILLLIFDPTVFRYSSAWCSDPILVDFSIFSYLAIGLGVPVLLVWLFARKLSRTVIAFIAGVLMLGSIFAAVVGLVILPFSFYGILACGIGLLGFIPFIISIVYARNAVRALRMATTRPHNVAPLTLAMAVSAGILVVTMVPALVQLQFVSIIDSKFQAMVDHPAEIQTRVAELVNMQTLCLGLCNTTIGQEYQRKIANLREQRNAIDNAYYAMTGDWLVNHCDWSD